MSYHKFSNLREILQGDLTSKLISPVQSLHFKDNPCNCKTETKADGECIYGGNCCKHMLIYKATCQCCGKYYIGNTQRKVKERMSDHFRETKDLVNTGKASDSFAKHFSQHLYSLKDRKENKQVTANDVRQITRVKVLWQGRAVSCMKTFGKVTCRLCMQERLEIHKALLTEKKNKTFQLINSAHELYGACRHKTRFHRFESLQSPSADEEQTRSENSMERKNNSTAPLLHKNSWMSQFCEPVSVEV